MTFPDLQVVPGQVGLDHVTHPHLDAAPPVLLLVRYSMGIVEKQPRQSPPTRRSAPRSPRAHKAFPHRSPAMFRYEISFTLPGSTRLIVEVKESNAPWEATDQVRAEYGAEIKIMQTRCL